jgi:hypothetical protein
MQLVEVTGKKLSDEFLLVNAVINKGNPNYIRPLDKDVNDVFDEKKNKTFRFGTVKRWILKNGNNEFLGRIAAFTNKRYKNKGDDLPVGGIGFFDSINDNKAANLLFDTAKEWLQQQGIEAMDGPINFGERDRWWGLVTEGFQEPMYCMNYNPPYYKELFQNYGFQRFFGQVCFGLDPKKQLSEKLIARHAMYAGDPDYKVVTIDKKNLSKFVDDFTAVYNAAWAGHGGVKQFKREQVAIMFEKMKPVLDERIVWYTYYKEKPIAIFVNLPDLNQWFKHLNGKFDLFHKLKFLWVKKTKPCKKFTGIVFGIIPEYQGKGIDAFMVREAYDFVFKTDYSEYEMQWIGDFNPKMLNVAANVGDTFRSRVLVTYRYLFDRTKEFKPHPAIS